MIPSADLARFGLMLVRPGLLVISAPVFGGTFVPAPIRIGLTVLLGVVIGTHVAAPVPSDSVSLVLNVAGEAAIGLALGMGLRCIIAAAEFGGHLAGFQLGLSYAALIDPQSGVRNNVLATLYANIALMAFLGINGHHALISGLVSTYETLPIGGAALSSGIGAVVVSMLGIVFVTGVRLAMPVVTALLIVELALGLLARAAPALNLMVVGTPTRLLVGLLVLAGAIQVVPGVVSASTRPAMDAALRLVQSLR